MDLSWNYAAESQAYDRCHRIGQEKSVYVKRLVVENTIEERSVSSLRYNKFTTALLLNSLLKLQDVKTSACCNGHPFG